MLKGENIIIRPIEKRDFELFIYGYSIQNEWVIL